MRRLSEVERSEIWDRFEAMMPHPERLADAALGGDDGRAMFDSLVEALG